MRSLKVSTVLTATIVAASAPILPAAAQVQDRWPDPPKPAQAAPAPAPITSPAPRRAPQAQVAPAGEEPLQDAPPKKPAAPPAAANVVACSGVFAQDSAHMKLAVKYDSRNLTFGQVEGPEGTKIPGTILFPNDPKRRLEVLWTNDAGRSGTSVIAINGKSQWGAPKGMKLGLPLAALEKANGKPFKISGFGADGTAGVAGWEDGALNTLPGGCKMGMKLAVDPKSKPEERSAVSGDKQFMSSDASVRALKPTVVEILIGY